MVLFYQNLSMDSDSDESGCNRKFLDYIMDCLLLNDRHKSTVAAMLTVSIARIVEMLLIWIRKNVLPVAMQSCYYQKLCLIGCKKTQSATTNLGIVATMEKELPSILL